MEEISPNLVKDINLQIQETQQTSNGKNIKKNMPRNIIVKLQKKKKRERENIESKERKMTYYTSQIEKQNSNDY